MSTIFLSYRRADNMDVADRMHERLCGEFGESEVFYDQEDIKVGQNYESRMITEARGAEVMLVLIGPNWQPARLHTETDAVRLELEAALDNGVTVLPVLLGDAVQMPARDELPETLKTLQTQNAFRLGSGLAFRQDVVHLIDELKRIIQERTQVAKSNSKPDSASGRSGSVLLLAVILVAAILIAGAIWFAPKQLDQSAQSEKVHTVLELRSSVGPVNVTLDGLALGQTPISTKVPFAENSRQLTFSRRGYVTVNVILDSKLKRFEHTVTLTRKVRPKREAPFQLRPQGDPSVPSESKKKRRTFNAVW